MGANKGIFEAKKMGRSSGGCQIERLRCKMLLFQGNRKSYSSLCVKLIKIGGLVWLGEQQCRMKSTVVFERKAATTLHKTVLRFEAFSTDRISRLHLHARLHSSEGRDKVQS